jgi:hypothetical protein
VVVGRAPEVEVVDVDPDPEPELPPPHPAATAPPAATAVTDPAAPRRKVRLPMRCIELQSYQVRLGCGPAFFPPEMLTKDGLAAEA